MNRLFDYLTERMAGKQENAVEYLDEDGNLYQRSYNDLFLDIHRARKWLKDIGLLPGEKLAFLATNSYAYLAMIMAIWGNGSIAVLLNPNNSFEEISYELDLVAPKWILQDSYFAELEEGFLTRYGRICKSISAFMGNTAEIMPPADCKMTDLSTIIFTSGTTGRSKGVMLSYENILFASQNNAYFVESKAFSGGEEKLYFSFPLYHVAGLITSVSWFRSGWPLAVCLDKRFFFRDISTLKCSHIIVTPGEVHTICKFFLRGKKGFLGICKTVGIGGAASNPDDIRVLLAEGIKPLVVYGLSENSGLAIAGNYGEIVENSIGRPFGAEVSLQNGEICLRSKGVMMGYYHDPESTAAVLSGGWLHTGDLGQVDSKGCYYITGRVKNLIILGSGENVSPEELEKLLLQDPRILECLVQEFQGRIAAEIYSEESEETVAQIVNSVNLTLPFYKRIAVFRCRKEALEKTSSGKIKRKEN